MAEAEPLHHARPELLDQDIGLRDHRSEPRQRIRRLEIELDRILAPVEHRERRRRLAEARREAAHVLSAGPLDFDNACTRLRKEEARQRPGQERREIEDQQVVQRQHPAPLDSLFQRIFLTRTGVHFA